MARREGDCKEKGSLDSVTAVELKPESIGNSKADTGITVIGVMAVQWGRVCFAVCGQLSHTPEIDVYIFESTF